MSKAMGDDCPGKILVVDDEEKNRKLLRHVLLHGGYTVIEAGDGVRALSLLRDNPVDLVLLDVMMPAMDGYEACGHMQADALLRSIPVIFVTALNESSHEVKGFEAGAVDFISKPIKAEVVLARVRTHIALKKAREKIEAQNRELLEAAKLREDVERISRHDLKNPLMYILNVPQLLLRGGSLTAEEEELTRGIIEAGYTMLEMINSSLDLFKMEQGIYPLQAVEVNLVRILSQIIRESRESASAGAFSFRTMKDGAPLQENDAFFIWGEELLCYSLLSNLLKNAIEASPQGGEIVLDLVSGKSNTICIHNLGMVPEEVQGKFFDKYVTAGKKKGTGLGTYSAKLMAETLGGEIDFSTSREEGTTVRVSLPAVNIS